MRRAALAVALAASLAGGCATQTVATRVGPNHVLVCDTEQNNGACDGANPEKGIRSACLPWGRTIMAIRDEDPKTGQGIIVTCGPSVPGAKDGPPAPSRTS